MAISRSSGIAPPASTGSASSTAAASDDPPPRPAPIGICFSQAHLDAAGEAQLVETEAGGAGDQVVGDIDDSNSSAIAVERCGVKARSRRSASEMVWKTVRSSW